MVDCPKCGFRQPKDQFCASCGIDIAHYVPPAAPISEQIKRHWALPSVILFAVSFCILYTYNSFHRRTHSLAFLNEARPAPQTVPIAQVKRPSQPIEQVVMNPPKTRPDDQLAVGPDAPTAQVNALVQDSQTSAATASAPPAVHLLNRQEQSALGKGNMAPTAAKPRSLSGDALNGQSTVRVRYLLIPADDARDLMTAADQLANYDEFTVGVLSNTEADTLLGRSQRNNWVLSSSSQTTQGPQHTARFSEVKKDRTASGETGLSFEIAVAGTSGSAPSIGFNLLRTLNHVPANSRGLASLQNFRLNLVEPGVVVLQGFAPQRPLAAEDIQFLSDHPVLKGLTHLDPGSTVPRSFVIFIDVSPASP